MFPVPRSGLFSCIPSAGARLVPDGFDPGYHGELSDSRRCARRAVPQRDGRVRSMEQQSLFGDGAQAVDAAGATEHERERAAARALELRQELEYHAYRYYALDAPEITDAEFDRMLAELQGIERAYPDLVTPDSYTQRVGGYVSEQFAPVEHMARMYSIDDAMDLDELDQWLERTEASLAAAGLPAPSYTCELKIDGLGIALTHAPRPRRARAHGGRRRVARRGPRRGLHAQDELRAPERRSGRRGARPLREPAQRRGRVPAPEGPQGDGLARPGDVRLRGRRYGAAPRLLAGRLPRMAPRRRFLRQPQRRDVLLAGGSPRVLRPCARAPRRPGLRHRRRRGEGRLVRRPGRARLHRPRAALVHRVQVPARGEGDRAA